MEPPILNDLEARVDPRHSALLIIDMQKDLCVEGFVASRAGRDITATRAIIPALERMLAAAREAGVLVGHIGFWTLENHLSDSASWLAQRRRATYSSDRLCMENSEGAEFVDELSPRPGEIVIRKHRYSAFKGTDLEMLLRAREIKTVVTTGVSTNVCVESTLRDAFEFGYYVCVPGDGVASWDMTLHEATLQTVTHRFGLVTTCDEVVAVWRALSARPMAAAG